MKIKEDTFLKFVVACLRTGNKKLIEKLKKQNKEEKMTDKEKIRTEDLEKAAIQQCYELLKDETIVIDGYEFVVLSDAEKCFKAGANWQKEQMIEKVCEWLMSQSCCGYIDDVEVDEFINRFRKAMGKKINMCGECKWFSCDDRGRCICTKKEWGNRKASPFVGACFNYFERKEEEK